MDSQIWLYLTFAGGLLLWMLNKANDRSQGIDPKVARWPDYFKVYWIPLLSRFIIEMAIYGVLFNQEMAARLFEIFGLPSWAAGTKIFAQYKLAAFGLGFTFDAQLDRFLASPLSAKIPLINLIPSIPPPQHLDPPPPTQAQVEDKAVAQAERKADEQGK